MTVFFPLLEIAKEAHVGFDTLDNLHWMRLFSPPNLVISCLQILCKVAKIQAKFLLAKSVSCSHCSQNKEIQSWIDLTGSCMKLIPKSIPNQTARAKEQFMKRWSIVSSASPQKMQLIWRSKLCFLRLSLVVMALFMKRQTKTRILFGKWTFQNIFHLMFLWIWWCEFLS